MLEALRAENERLKTEIADLKVAIEKLRSEIEQMKPKAGSPPLFVKANTHREKGKPPHKTRKKRAAEQNAARKKSIPTETRQHALERCPDCNTKLSGQSIARRREVIDLPEMPPVQVIEHQVIKRWCPKCKKWHTPALDLSGEVLGQSRIGHRAASMVSWLRTTLRLPVKQVQTLLQQVYGLEISVGEIVELAHAVAKAGQATVKQIGAAILKAPHVHMDETTWRESGDNGYVWACSTPSGLRSFAFKFSRAASIPETILEGFEGTLVTDFYAGYNYTDGKHQRCWAHLLRDLRDLDKEHSPQHPELPAWITAVIQTYRDGKDFVDRSPPPAERQIFFESLVAQVRELGLRWPQDKGHPAHALCKRLLRHEAELFEFVLQPGLAPTNNLAERSVRPLVIARKISGGSRSARGSQTRMDLQTLFATWAAQGISALVQCYAMLVNFGMSLLQV